MDKEGKLVVVSGPSGAGKGTVIKELMQASDEYVLSVSATTRAMREGDKEGVDYFFLSREAFLEKIEHNGFLEYAVYNNNFYGTPRAFVEEKLAQGKNVILEIEVQGALQIKKLFPRAVLVFLTPESFGELERRLRNRGTETDEQIAQRLTIARREAPNAFLYDYVVLNRNGCAAQAAQDILDCVRAEGLRPFDNRAAIADFLPQ